MSKRDTYSDVGEETRQMIDRLLTDPKTTATELRVALVVVRYLTTWSRLSDRITRQQFTDATGRDRRNIQRALHSLNDRGIIGYRPGSPGRASTLSLRGSQTPPTEGVGTTPSKGATQTPVGGAWNPTEGAHGTPRRGQPAPPSEKGSEDQPRNPPDPAHAECLAEALGIAQDPTSTVARLRRAIHGATDTDIIAFAKIEADLWDHCEELHPERIENPDYDWTPITTCVEDLTTEIINAVNEGDIPNRDALASLTAELVGVGR